MVDFVPKTSSSLLLSTISSSFTKKLFELKNFLLHLGNWKCLTNRLSPPFASAKWCFFSNSSFLKDWLSRCFSSHHQQVFYIFSKDLIHFTFSIWKWIWLCRQCTTCLQLDTKSWYMVSRLAWIERIWEDSMAMKAISEKVYFVEILSACLASCQIHICWKIL